MKQTCPGRSTSHPCFIYQSKRLVDEAGMEILIGVINHTISSYVNHEFKHTCKQTCIHRCIHPYITYKYNCKYLPSMSSFIGRPVQYLYMHVKIRFKGLVNTHINLHVNILLKMYVESIVNIHVNILLNICLECIGSQVSLFSSSKRSRTNKWTY